ncbi:MAG: glycosyltransferase family 2 protein, partial [Butyrivibrio sp.]
MKEELVSVIIPIYNASKYLGNTIECILNQTYKNLEIIL